MRTLLKIGIAVALLTALSAPAKADAVCAAGSTCQVQLTQTNTNQLIGVVVTVTIDNTGTNTVLTFQVTSSPIPNTVQGFIMVGWNANASSTSSTGYDGNNVLVTKNPAQLDGFGKFVASGANNGLATNGLGPVTFTLNGLVTTFPANADGNEFVVHIQYDGNCSGWVGGATGSTSPGDNLNCGTVIPEPASLALFGTGLVGIAGLVRRRIRR